MLGAIDALRIAELIVALDSQTVHEGGVIRPIVLPNPSISADCQWKWVQPLSKSIDFANAVILVFVCFFEKTCFSYQNLLVCWLSRLFKDFFDLY